jgi:hypothetical protein
MNPIGMNPRSTRTRERFAKYARRVRAYARRRQAMSKWLVVTEVESEIDPAMWSYVNGTTLVSSQLVEGESNE